jgi:hypothetical protein
VLRNGKVTPHSGKTPGKTPGSGKTQKVLGNGKTPQTGKMREGTSRKVLGNGKTPQTGKMREGTSRKEKALKNGTARVVAYG